MHLRLLWYGMVTAWTNTVALINQSITIQETTAQNFGFVLYDPSAPTDSKYYRTRVRDDGDYDGHWVLESLNDDIPLNTVILNTDNLGDISLALSPINFVTPANLGSTAIATTAFVRDQTRFRLSADLISMFLPREVTVTMV